MKSPCQQPRRARGRIGWGLGLLLGATGLVVVGAITVALLVPAVQRGAEKARFGNGLLMASDLRQWIEDEQARNGPGDRSCSRASCLPALASRLADNGVNDLSSDRSGRITATVQVPGLPPAQRVLTLQPTHDGQAVDLSQPAAGRGPFTWVCRSSAPADRLPASCR
jgi:Pilin (bacterial filament)